MTKSETIKDLTLFAEHMNSASDYFSEMFEVTRKLSKEKGRAYSCWPALLIFLSWGFGLYALMGVFYTVYPMISGIPVEQYFADEWARYLKDFILPFPLMPVVALIMSVFFVLQGKREAKEVANDKLEFNKTLRHQVLLRESIKEIYDDYENPPVGFEYCDPMLISNVIKTIENSENDITIADAIKKTLNI